MPGSERSQEFCEHCRKMTLHEYDPDTTNHVLHLIGFLFCCVFWLPVWILIILTAPTRYLRCTVCGQVLGDDTPEDQIAIAERREQLEDARRKAARARAAKAKQRAAIPSSTAAPAIEDDAGEPGPTLMDRAAAAGEAIGDRLRATDDWLVRSIGDVYLARGIEVVVGLVLLGGLVAGLWFGARAFL